MEILAIEREEDLFSALQRVAEGTLGDDVRVEFKGWPRYEITIRGEHFHGGVPTRIMPALLSLQKEVDLAYARMKHGKPKRLTAEERQQTELVVFFEAGTTTFITEIWKVLNTIAKEGVGKMSGAQVMITILGFTAIVSGGPVAGAAWKDYLAAKATEKGMDLPITKSPEETRCTEILANAMNRNSLLEEQVRRLRTTVQDDLLRRLAPGDELVIDGEAIIDGQSAREILRAPRADAVDSRADGKFIIVSVESGLVRGGFRLKVRNIDTAEELLVKVPDGTLSPEQIETLQSGEWGKKPLGMKLNVRKAGERIIEAVLIEAGLS